MKRHVLFFIFFLILVLFLAPSVRAKVISSEKEVIVGEDEVVDDDLFVAGESVVIEGTINGDLYAAGGNIKISGTVNGDVMAAGGTLDIIGEIKDDVRVAGGNINIREASIGDSLTVAGGNVNVEEGSTIGGGVLFGAGSMNINTNVTRGIMGGGGLVTIDGAVGKNIYVGTEQLTLGPNTVVAGDLTYSGEKEVRLLEPATVSGRVHHILPTTKKVTVGMTKPAAKTFKFGIKLWSYLAALLVGGLVIYLFPKASQQVVKRLETNWLGSLGWGFLLLLLTPLALVLIMITVIGIPLAVILGLLFVIDLYLSKLIVGMALGRKLESFLSKQKMSVFLSFALGLAVYYVLSTLPVLRVFVKLIALLLGLGALFSYKRSQLLLKNK